MFEKFSNEDEVVKKIKEDEEKKKAVEEAAKKAETAKVKPEFKERKYGAMDVGEEPNRGPDLTRGEAEHATNTAEVNRILEGLEGAFKKKI